MSPERLAARDVSRRTLLSGTAVLATAAACGSPGRQPVRAPAPPATPRGDAALRALFERTARATTTPAALMLYRTPAGAVGATYGTRSVRGTAPVTPADHFRIGSITKTFTGTAILQLAQEGALCLDDRVAKYRGDVPNGRHITIAQLLSMRSGLYNYSESLALNRSLDEHPAKVWTPDELLAVAFDHQPQDVPGRAFSYSNTNFVLLGLIVEMLDQQPLAASFKRRFFDRLGMRETLFPAADSIAVPTPHPQGYMYGSNVSTLDGAALPPEQQAAAVAGTLLPNDVTDENPSWAWAAGSAITTVDDLITWVTAMGDGSLLKPAWQRKRMESLQPTIPGSPDAPSYGLAIATFGPMYGHTGELPGFQAFCGYDPTTKRALVVLANLTSTPDGQPVASTIAKTLITTMYRENS